jgi:hypothetical protein
MKKILIFLLLARASFSITSPGAIDWIHDDYKDTKGHSIHSRGFLNYGAQTNTFHLTQFHLRYNYQLENVQFFGTLRGYHDTHDPAIAYQFILNNLSLFDYGTTIRLFKYGFVSLRGAAPYREGLQTYQIILPYYFADNAAEFDPAASFLTISPSGPGIRIGYADDKFEIGYSQGDYRHVIPSAIMTKYMGEDWYARLLFFFYYGDPANFRSDLLRFRTQLRLGGEYTLFGNWKLGGIADTTYDSTGSWRHCLEEAIIYGSTSLGFRQLFKTGANTLFEISLNQKFENVVSLGLYFASDSRVYIGSEVNF